MIIQINPKSNYVYQVDAKNPTELNCSLTTVFQAGKLEMKEEICLNIIKQLLHQIFLEEFKAQNITGNGIDFCCIKRRGISSLLFTMESNKTKLEEEFKKYEDWYKAIIFDTEGKIIASKNCDKLKEGELKYYL